MWQINSQIDHFRSDNIIYGAIRNPKNLLWYYFAPQTCVRAQFRVKVIICTKMITFCSILCLKIDFDTLDPHNLLVWTSVLHNVPRVNSEWAGKWVIVINNRTWLTQNLRERKKSLWTVSQNTHKFVCGKLTAKLTI